MTFEFSIQTVGVDVFDILLVGLIFVLDTKNFGILQ